MNPWQAAQQVLAALRAAVWPDAPGGVVFGAVIASVPGVYEDNQEARLPVARLLPGSEQPDPELPDRLVFAFEIAVVAEVLQEKHGAFSIIGGSRSGGLGSSAGRGCLELEEIARNAITALDPRLRLNVVATGGRAVDMIDAGERQLAERVFEVSMTGTRGRFYHAVRCLSTSALVGHLFSLLWKDPPARFDTLTATAVMVRFAAGSTAPATPTAGTLQAYVALGAQALSITKTGTFSYSIFCQYDENGDGTADRWSDPVSITFAS